MNLKVQCRVQDEAIKINEHILLYHVLQIEQHKKPERQSTLWFHN